MLLLYVVVSVRLLIVKCAFPYNHSLIFMLLSLGCIICHAHAHAVPAGLSIEYARHADIHHELWQGQHNRPMPVPWKVQQWPAMDPTNLCAAPPSASYLQSRGADDGAYATISAPSAPAIGNCNIDINTSQMPPVQLDGGGDALGDGQQQSDAVMQAATVAAHAHGTQSAAHGTCYGTDASSYQQMPPLQQQPQRQQQLASIPQQQLQQQVHPSPRLQHNQPLYNDETHGGAHHGFKVVSTAGVQYGHAPLMAATPLSGQVVRHQDAPRSASGEGADVPTGMSLSSAATMQPNCHVGTPALHTAEAGGWAGGALESAYQKVRA